MRSFAQLLLLICVALVVLTGATHVEAQALDYDAEFELEFRRTEDRFDRQIRRLRSIGWTLVGLGGTAIIARQVYAAGFDRETESDVGDLYGVTVVAFGSAAVGLLVGGISLVVARVKVERRRRFRERQAALDRSYFHPDVDIGITPGGLSLHLSF